MAGRCRDGNRRHDRRRYLRTDWPDCRTGWTAISAFVHCRRAGYFARRLQLHQDVEPLALLGRHRDDPSESLRSEEHTSELQSLMRISYAVFCLQKTKLNITHNTEGTKYNII